MLYFIYKDNCIREFIPDKPGIPMVFFELSKEPIYSFDQKLNFVQTYYIGHRIQFSMYNGSVIECFLYLREGKKPDNWMAQYIYKNFLCDKKTLERICMDCRKINLKLNAQNICETCENIREFDKHKMF